MKIKNIFKWIKDKKEDKLRDASDKEELDYVRKSVNDMMIARIFKEKDDFVFVESKVVSEQGEVGGEILEELRGIGKQMDDRWIDEALEHMKNAKNAEGQPIITGDLYKELDKAIRNKKIRKELVVVQNNSSGNTISKSIGDTGIKNVHLIKTGEDSSK